MAIGGLLQTANGKPLNTSMSIQRDGLRTGRREHSNEAAKKSTLKSLMNDANPAKYNKDQNVFFGSLNMEKSPRKNNQLDRSLDEVRIGSGHPLHNPTIGCVETKLYKPSVENPASINLNVAPLKNIRLLQAR